MELIVDNLDEQGTDSLPGAREASLEDVEAALRAMDGRVRTGVTLRRDSRDSYLAAAGGGGSGYSVFLWTSDEQEWAVVSNPHAIGITSILAGGQEVRYPRRHIVGLDAALEAFRAYFSGRDKAASLEWEKVSRDPPSKAVLSVSKLTGWRARLVAKGGAEIVRSVFEKLAQRSSLELYTAVMRRLWERPDRVERASELLQRVKRAPEARLDSADGREYLVGKAWEPVAMALQVSSAPDSSNAARRAMSGMVGSLLELGVELERGQAGDVGTVNAIERYYFAAARLIDASTGDTEVLPVSMRAAAAECGDAFARALDAIARANGWSS